MKIELRAAAKGPDRAPALPATSATFETGRVTLVEAETQQRPAVLGLIASGRMRPDSGTVLLDGRADATAIRRVTALVDAPEVCDPAPDVTVLAVVEEELMFAGRVSNVVTARRWAADNGFGALVRTPISAVAPRERIALLLELAALRAQVRALVLVAPDRHGGDPHEWWDVAQDFAARDYAVLVVAGRAAAMLLDGPASAAMLLDGPASAAPTADAASPSPVTSAAPPTPITTAEPTHPHNAPAERTHAADPTDPTDPDTPPTPITTAELTDPHNAPAERTHPTDPTDPTHPADPTDPDTPPTPLTTTEPTDPQNAPAERTEPDPGSHAEPDDTAEEGAR